MEHPQTNTAEPVSDSDQAEQSASSASSDSSDIRDYSDVSVEYVVVPCID